MLRRELHNLKPGQKFSILERGPLSHLVMDTSSIPLQPDRVPGVYSVRLKDGLAQWQVPGLVVWVESQHDKAREFGACGEHNGINWFAFYFPSHAQATAFYEWCQANDVQTDSVGYPTENYGVGSKPTDEFFSVRLRGG